MAICGGLDKHWQFVRIVRNLQHADWSKLTRFCGDLHVYQRPGSLYQRTQQSRVMAKEPLYKEALFDGLEFSFPNITTDYPHSKSDTQTNLSFPNPRIAMCDDAEVWARGCGHLYDLDIRRCPNAIQNDTTCPPDQRTRVRYPQDDHEGKCKSCQGQSPPDSSWYGTSSSSSPGETYII